MEETRKDNEYCNQRCTRPAKAYGLSVVLIINGPPSAQHLGVWTIPCRRSISPLSPRFLTSDEVYQVYARLKVSVGRDIRIVSRWRDVISEAEAIVVVLEVHVQKTLVRPVERDASFSHSCHGIVVTHIWRQNHHSGVEQVRPSDIRSGGEGMRQVEELIDGPVGDDVGIQVDKLSELSLLPQVDFGEC